MSEKHYSAPWGRRIWLITVVISLMGIIVTIGLLSFIQPKNKGDEWAKWVVPISFLTVIGGTSLWMIKGYTLTKDSIMVHRSFWNNRIPLNDIESVAPDPDACKGAFKTMGNDGLFAMHGRFRSKRLGKFQAYITNPSNAVILKTKDDTIVISPDQPRGFVRELERRLDQFNKQR